MELLLKSRLAVDGRVSFVSFFRLMVQNNKLAFAFVLDILSNPRTGRFSLQDDRFRPTDQTEKTIERSITPNWLRAPRERLA